MQHDMRLSCDTMSACVYNYVCACVCVYVHVMFTHDTRTSMCKQK